MVVLEEEARGEEKQCFSTVGFPRAGYVVDLNKWDGSDLVNAGDKGIVSARFIDIAIRQEARPFVAIPCLADVSACNKEELDRINSYAENHKSKLEYVDV